MKLLFVFYGGSHALCLLPVIKELIKIKFLKTYVLPMPAAIPLVEIHNLPYLKLSDFISASMQRKAYKYGVVLLKHHHNKALNIPEKESLCYLGENFYELVMLHGYQKAKKLFEVSGRQAFLPFKLMVRIINILKPNLVVTSNSPRAEKAALLAAQHYNIKTLCVPDGLGDTEQWIPLADYYAVMCNITAKNYINYGIDKNKIFITGSPAYIKKSSILSNLKYILYLPTHSRVFKKVTDYFFLLKNIAKKLNLEFIARAHPHESNPEILNILSNHYLSKHNLKELITGASVCVCAGTTAALHALVNNKPIISINIPYSRQMSSLIEENLAFKVEREETLYEKVKLAIKSKRRVFDYPDNPAQNIVSLIMDILNSKL